MSARILIVEDELIVALELEDRLTRHGYAVAGTARSVEQALAIVEATRVDLALLDLRLAGPSSGVDLARDLRSRDIPFVFLTAHGDEETLARVKSVEPQGYLLKPFDARLLRLTIETALHRHASERERLAAIRGQRAAEAMQAAILEHSPDGVLVLAEGGEIVLGNRAAQQMFGLDESYGTIDALLPDFDEPTEGERITSRLEARRRDGTSFPVEVAFAFAPSVTGARSILIVRDVTARVELEEQLVRARQLEVAGRVAAGIAHDLNNLLSVVWMSTYMIQRAPTPELPTLLDDLEKAINLGASLTARLSSLSRRSAGEAREIAVNDALRTLARLARRALGSKTEVVLELDPQTGSIQIDPAHLDQLVLNLALNADHAMPDGGTLTIRSRADSGDDGSRVIIEVEDTGLGMNAAVKERVFEPFFSTRAASGGTGLGLSIVKDIVEQIGGALELESEPGRGTRFRFSIARHADADTEADEGALLPGGSFGHGRAVLLVDCDELHRGMVSRLLETRGFRAVEARCAGEAMLIAERGGEPLSLAVVDFEMPYMDGRELSERLEQLHPGLPIILVVCSPTSLDREDVPVNAILRKPLEPEVLLAEVARLVPGQRKVG